MSKTIKLSLPHRLSQAEATQRIASGIAELRKVHGAKLTSVQETWNGNHMDFRVQAMNQTVSGRVDVMPSDVQIEVDLPWMLAMIAGKFTRQVEAEGRKLLEEKK